MQSAYIEVLELNGMNPSAAVRGLPSLDAIIFSGAGLVLLFIGSWMPNPRLNFSGVPVDTAAMLGIGLLATLSAIRIDTLRLLALLQIPLLLLGITIAWSPSPEVGIDNLTSLVLTSFLAFLLLNTVVERHGEVELARTLLMYLAVYLGAAIIYKAIFGFFDRQVVFFLNGPIIFGRFMCIALILSLYAFRGSLRMIFTATFYLAILWTESKGPVLAATVTVLVLFWFSSRRLGKIAVVICGLAAIISIVIAADQYDLSARQIGRLAVLLNALSGDTTLPMLLASSGRSNLWTLAIDLISTHPMGVGLGGFINYYPYVTDTAYPHNLFLELWCEGGIVLGTIASIPLLIFLAARKSAFWYVALCLLLAQMVSGNISDARQMYVFALLAILSRTAAQYSLPEADLSKEKNA